MKKCCFTGHRNVVLTPQIEKDLNFVVRRLIEVGVEDFYAGGAIGWDTICAKTVIRFRDEKYHHIKLHLVLPCPESQQTAKWSAECKRVYYDVLNQADSIQVLSDKYHRNCMKDRNQWLIEHSDCCVCYYNKNQSASGTGQTFRMALMKGLRVFNICKC